MADFNVWGYLARLGTRVLSPGDATFQSGDEVCAVNEPILLVLQDVEEFLHQEYQEFQCSAPGKMLFKSMQWSYLFSTLVGKKSTLVLVID